ncbi:MAG TPA: heparan-alpha-glucosaminide N-acetyltransferase domain-containing protein [Micromonosporaceae bacterium]|nr:heparan-alpha-glucosaminide N-acetyltransferase domain-containing protein [Micromonosporaceae bacterium]
MTQSTLPGPTVTGPVNDAEPLPPVTSGRRSRLAAVDAIRGVALLGMIAVHSLDVSDAAGQPTWSYTVFGGRAAAGFAVLAGVGIAFMTGRRRVRLAAGPGMAAMLGVRALAIAVIGLMLGYADASLGVVILPYYALMFVLAIPLVFLPTWAVGLVGVTAAVGVPALSHLLLPRLPEPVLANVTVGRVVDDPVGLLTELSMTGPYPALPWMAYLCAGLVVGRLALATKRVARRLFAVGSLLAVAAPAASWILLERFGGRSEIYTAAPESGLTVAETRQLLAFGAEGTAPTSTWWWLAVDAPHTNTPLALLGTTGAVLALLGVLLLARHLARPVLRGMVAVVQEPVAAAGSMPLTFYTVHIMFINSGHDIYRPVEGFLLQLTAVLLIGLAWRATAGRGPLEGLIVMLTNRVRNWSPPVPRLRRSRPAAGADPIHDNPGGDEAARQPVGSLTGS